ncbi:MAG TPA: sugar transferase [Actinomycetota bacterium]|nr:sugar transferase [Actinomycetota bacterium]
MEQLLGRAPLSESTSLTQGLVQTAHLDRLELPLGGPAGERSPDAVGRLYRRIAAKLALADAACLVFALMVSYLVRFGFSPLPGEWVALVATAPFVWIGVFHAFHLHSPQHTSSWEQFKNVISASGVGVIAVAMVSFWSHSTFSRAWLGLTWGVALVAELVVRRLFDRHIAKARADGRLAFRTLIVGANNEAGSLAHALKDRHLGFRPLGYVSVETSPVEANGIRVLGHIDDIECVIEDHQAECLFVASSAVSAEDMLRVAQASRRKGVELKVSANVPQMLTSRLNVQPVGDVMSLSLRPVRLTRGQMFTKRALDVVVSAAALLVAAPVLAVVAVAVKLSSPGPVLFKQKRVTKDGHVFSVLKFRTMRTDGDRILEEMGIDPKVPFFKLQDDPRVTRIGNLIRKTSIDELPQLINVIRGEMSLVGPRPLPVDQVLANEHLLSPRHEVKSGVTGWWQIQGRSDVTPEEALRLDLFYIENWSLSLDVYVLLKTIEVLIKRKGAY